MEDGRSSRPRPTTMFSRVALTVWATRFWPSARRWFDSSPWNQIERNGLDGPATAWRHVGMTEVDKPLKGVPGLCRSCGHEYWVIAPEQMPLALDAASKLMLQTSCPRCGVGVNQIGMINRPPRSRDDDREQATPQPAEDR